MANEVAKTVSMHIVCKVMDRTLATRVSVLLVLLTFGIAAEAKSMDYTSLRDLMQKLNIRPSSRKGSEPYASSWEGIVCTNTRVTSLKLTGMGLKVQLPADIQLLIEIETLDLSLNKNLTGPIPTSIGNLTKLVNLNLAGCSLNGSIPETIGSLKHLFYLLNWMRRLKVALGTARGLAYLHEHATPPIIHHDIKPNNILLDKHLNAKVADFGLSKSLAGSDRDHVTTQVKGTMGYLDPEYFMTHELTEKSDVYSFGVVMLELITARRPIEHGKYIVREVEMRIDTTKLLYNLQDILDPATGLVTELTGLEMFVDMEMLCVKDTCEERTRMGQVVKEIEKIIQVASFDITNSASTSAGYQGGTKDGSEDPYSSRSLEYSGIFDYKDS